MKTTKYFVWAALTLALGACNDDQEFYGESKRITIEAGFGGSSRVATNGLSSMFEKKDAIGVYVWTGSTVLPGESKGFVANNVTNTFDGKTWTATPQMLWKDAETPHYFLSVYPQTDILTTTTYTLDPADQEQSDLLVAMNFGQDNAGIVAQTNPVPLAFGHVMAKLRVNLKFTEEFSKKPKVELVTVVAKNKATIDWQTATATATGDVTGIEFPALSTAAQGYACSYESVMVPQDGFRSVAIVIGEETYTFNSSQQMQLKKGTITTLNLSVGLNSVKMDDISILDWTYGTSISGYLNNIDAQIAAINGSIDDLKAVDTELSGYISALQTTATELQAQIDAANTALAALEGDLEGQITASEQKVLNELNTVKTTLEGQLATINSTIATLQAKDAELEQKIADLQKYVDSEIKATEDWASATFSTLEQYEATQTAISEINALIKSTQGSITALEEKLNKKIADDIAAAVAGVNADMAAKVTEITDAYTAAIQAAKEDITAAYTDAIKAAITASETSMKEWVNGVLADGYYTKAEIDGKIAALATQVTEGDTALQEEIDALTAALAKAESDLTAAYKKAIEDAIAANNGTITEAIAEAVKAAQDELQAQINAIEIRLAALEGDVEALKSRIQSIRFLPEYSDGKVKIESGMSAVELTFIVSPKEAAAIAADKVTAFIYHTQSRAVDAVPLTVTDVSGNATTGMLTVSITPPAQAYWATGITANIYIQINDGNNDIISEMIPASYYYDYVTFSAESEQTFSWDEPLLPMSARTSRTTTNGTFEYSVGEGEWKTLAENQQVTFGGTNGDLRLRGIAPEGTNGKQIEFGYATPVACSGDIRTLVNYTSSETISTATACFSGLFENCSALADASKLKLISNNNEMVEYCYAYMFSGCESLTSAPELPATTLAQSCYEGMFAYCENLESAPALPATTLAQSCYKRMFAGCTSLTTAPALPAKKLASYCYVDMFNGCTNLTSAPALPATTLAQSCYLEMFAGCSNLTTAPALPATTLANNCYQNMFVSCSKLESAPELPAETLVTGCYWQMFKDCTSLKSVTMLATNISANGCLTDWMSGVATTGTFTKAEGMTNIPTNSTSGIPTGWTVKVKSVEQGQETLPGFNYVIGY